MQQVLVRAGPRLGDQEDPLGVTPPRRGHHRAPVGGEADQRDPLVAVPLADQLADVDHPGGGHVGGPGVADVGVVLPDDSPGFPTVKLHQRVECLGHVGVADVPRLVAKGDHRPVIFFGFGNHLSIHFGIECCLGVVVVVA